MDAMNRAFPIAFAILQPLSNAVARFALFAAQQGGATLAFHLTDWGNGWIIRNCSALLR